MPPLELELAEKLALLVALTLFLGFAFEQIQKRDEPAIQGGIRTFPLVGLAGALLYLVEPQRAWHLPRAFLPSQRGYMLPSLRGAVGDRQDADDPASSFARSDRSPLRQPPCVAVGPTVAAVLVMGTRERMHGLVRLIP